MSKGSLVKQAQKQPRAVQKVSELYKVRLAMMQSGERIPLLVDAETGLPLGRPNQYMLRDRRPRCETATLEKELRHIAVLYTWARISRLDINERLWSGDGLQPHEVRSLIDVARLDMRDQKNNEVDNNNIQALVKPTVSNPTWASRLMVIRDYITWNLEEAVARSEIGTLRHQHLTERQHKIAITISSSIPHDEPGKSEGLSPELRERLWDIARPQSAENPWQPALRYRNQLIVQIMSRMGPRRGDLLKVRVSGVQTGLQAYIHISRERDSPEDSRRYEPRPKTLERKIPLGAALRGMTDDYLLKERARIQGAKRTPYLIVSREGTPLTLSGLREVVEQITRRHQEFAGVLSPHVLRHTASDLWWAELQKTPLDVTARKEILNYLMGWSENSTQGQKYPRGEIIRTAQDFALKAQAALFKPVESTAP